MRSLWRRLGGGARKPNASTPGDLSTFLMEQPFTPAELAQVPAGWRPRMPDFVGVGYGKAGTSWWYRLIVAHPSVAPNRLHTKELQYFYHFGSTGIPREAIALYHQAFAAPEGKLCGEWSPGYLCYPLAMAYLAEAAPAAKILVIVRNPIDRMLSAVNQIYSARLPALGLQGSAATLFEKHSAFPETVWSGLLMPHFAQLYSLFKPEQTLVLQYEKCKADLLGELARTYRFLGLDAEFVPQRPAQPVNRKDYAVAPFSPEQRAHLARYFAADVRQFAETYGLIDLTLWQDFAP